jgi:hypothetical protein
MFTPSVCKFLIHPDLILEFFFSVQVAIHAVLTTRIVLKIKLAGYRRGQQPELHTSYLEMPAVTVRLPWFVPDVDFQEQSGLAISLEPLPSTILLHES